MIYHIIISALSQFMMKLLSAAVSETMLKKIFFYCARRLASYTDTPIDDRFVEELYKEFHKVDENKLNKVTES